MTPSEIVNYYSFMSYLPVILLLIIIVLCIIYFGLIKFNKKNLPKIIFKYILIVLLIVTFISIKICPRYERIRASHRYFETGLRYQQLSNKEKACYYFNISLHLNPDTEHIDYINNYTASNKSCNIKPQFHSADKVRYYKRSMSIHTYRDRRYQIYSDGDKFILFDYKLNKIASDNISKYCYNDNKIYMIIKNHENDSVKVFDIVRNANIVDLTTDDIDNIRKLRKQLTENKSDCDKLINWRTDY